MSQERRRDLAAALTYTPTVFSIANDPPGRLGLKLLLAIELVTLASLLVAVWMAAGGPAWTPSSRPGATISIAMTALLGLGSLALVLGRERRPRAVLIAVALLGLGFAALSVLEWRTSAALGLVLGSSRFTDGFYLLTAFHLVHVIAGSAVLAVNRSPADAERWRLYEWLWHAIALAWLPIAATFYWVK